MHTEPIARIVEERPRTRAMRSPRMRLGADRHRAEAQEEIEAYLRGDLDAAMGFRSTLGVQLDAIRLSRPPPDPEHGVVEPQGYTDTEINAAAASRRARALLSTLPVAHRGVLCAHFVPREGGPLRIPELGEFANCAEYVATSTRGRGVYPGGWGASVDGEPARLRRLARSASGGPWREGARGALARLRAWTERALEVAFDLALSASPRDVAEAA